MSKIKELIKKHWDVVSYLFFGVLHDAGRLGDLLGLYDAVSKNSA